VQRLTDAAGLRMRRRSYCITALLPVIFFFRLAQKLVRPANRGRPKTAIRPLPALPNRMLIWLLRLETWWLLRVPLPFGVSVVCVAEKPRRGGQDWGVGGSIRRRREESNPMAVTRQC